MDQSQEPVKIAELVDTNDTVEEMPLSSVTLKEENIPETANEEESEEALEEVLIETEKPEPIEIVEDEEIPEIEEKPIREETREVKEQELFEEEESASLPVDEPPPVEQPPIPQPPVIQQSPAQQPPPPVQQPPVQQPPPVNQPPVQQQPPAQQPPPAQQQPPVQQQPSPAQQPSPPAQQQAPVQQPPPAQQPPAQQPPTQSQVPERTAPRPPPSPPPFLGPAEPEITPPSRQEPIVPVIPELPSLPRDEKPEEQVVFSRVVRLTVGQMLEIPFRGTGWVYLGELGNRRGLNYDSRRLDTQGGNTIGQSFIFRAEIAGTYILKFYRQDFIQDYIINDYVQVIVGEADDSGRGRPFSAIERGRVIAEPRWPSILEAAGSTGETVSPATGTATGTPRPDAVQTVEPAGVEPAARSSTPVTVSPSQTGASPSPDVTVPAASAERTRASESLSPEEYVRQAKQEFDAGRVEQALVIIEQMRQRYPSGTDEAWWLLGQLYEANNPLRDIKLSLECYRTLVNEYPQSNRVDDARRRIAYLERYYLNIR